MDSNTSHVTINQLIPPLYLNAGIIQIHLMLLLISLYIIRKTIDNDSNTSHVTINLTSLSLLR